MHPFPAATSVSGGEISWSAGRCRTGAEGIQKTMEFSFVVELPPDVGYVYPEIWILPRSQTEQVTHPDMGKAIWGSEGSFEGETYEIASTRRFKVKQLKSTVARKYRLDAIIVAAR